MCFFLNRASSKILKSGRSTTQLRKEQSLGTDSNTLSCDDELIDWLRDVLALNGFDLWNNNKALRGENVDFQEETDSCLAKNWFPQRNLLCRESNTCQFFYIQVESLKIKKAKNVCIISKPAGNLPECKYKYH